MIELSGLRKYVLDDSIVRLEADIKFVDVDEKFPVDTIYFELDKAFGEMFVEDTYDPFVLVPLWLAMYNHTDLRICGNLSKKLYKNLTWYVQKILCDFFPKFLPVKIFVDGFAPTEAKGTLIGTGISCGVDSFSTIYDRFVREDDLDYKINALFFFNCGSHGNFGDELTQKVFVSRGLRSLNVANELGLPIFFVDTNLHAFRHEEDKSNILFLAFYSCVLALQNVIRRYYVSSGCSYSEIKAGGVKYTHCDLANFCESFLLPLIQTERTELIVDGCQYRRVDKLKNIADWSLAQKYLNVCLTQKDDDSTNCGECEKCLRTLLPLEILGKLDAFANVFDVAAYKKISLKYKAQTVANADNNLFFKEHIDLAEENNFPMPEPRDCFVLDKQVVIFGKE